MKTSNTIAELAKALSAAQAVMAGARKDSENPHFRSRYADLASVWEACREALTSHGLSVVQATDTSDRQEVVVITTLLHASGEWISSTIAVPVQKNDAQGYLSALTYARRGALAAMVGVAPEDDDGNAASRAAPSLITAEQVAHLHELLEASGAHRARFLKHFKAQRLDQILQQDYPNAVSALKAKMESSND